MEPLDIQLGRIVSHKVGKFSREGIPYLIGRTTTGATVKGDLLKAIEGERYRLWGEWKPQDPWNGKPQPDAFCFFQAEPIIDESEDGVAQYLSTFVDGLGPVRSGAIVEAFGADTLKILRTEPERAGEVAGISPEIVEAIRTHFEREITLDPVAYSTLIGMFAGFKIPKAIIKSLVIDFGSSAPQVVKDDPYLLVDYPRMGWTTVDRFALAPAIGYPREGIERHAAALAEALAQVAEEGHTYASQGDVEAITFKLLGTRVVPEAWAAAIDAGKLARVKLDDGQTVFALPKLATAEVGIAGRLATLSAQAAPLPFSFPDDGLLAGQVEALRLIEGCGVVIVAGAPGTGKTYAITKTLTGLINNGFKSIEYLAPTGKAAKRAAELLQRALPGCSIVPSTIHRGLEPIPSGLGVGVPTGKAKHGRGRSGFMFARNGENPIEAQIVVVDESSMVDSALASDLVEAVASGTRVIFVGDPNQLPSVGPGSVLRDMIAAGVPTATLTEIQRNSGRIVEACHAIMRGETPKPSARLDWRNKDNWGHIEASDPEKIAEIIVKLHESARTNYYAEIEKTGTPGDRFEPTWDMQVISPEKRKPGVGCNDLNNRLANLLNRYRVVDPSKGALDDTGRPSDFEIGDKVIRTKNGIADLMTPIGDETRQRADFRWDGLGYRLAETDVVNGDMGLVRDIIQQPGGLSVLVQLVAPDRLVKMPYADCHLSLAYAITCHKAQGSGFPYVIVPVHNSFYYNDVTKQGLWNREMIYTLFSRAEKLLITVGQMDAIGRAIGRKNVTHRRTRLKGLLAPHFAPQDAAVAAEEFAIV